MDFLAGLAVGFLFWDWVALGIASIVFGGSVYYNSSLGFIIALAALVFVLIGIPEVEIGTLITLAVTYIPMGVIWSLFKYRSEAKKVALSLSRHTTVTESKVADALSSRLNKDIIGYWIIAWPLSIIGYVIFDFVTDLVSSLIEKLGSLHRVIIRSVVSNYGDK